MRKIELCKLSVLREHPKNKRIFGDIESPETRQLLDEIKVSIIRQGLQEPIIVKKDGTVLSGHLRLTAVQELIQEEVVDKPNVCVAARMMLRKKIIPVRVHPNFEREEDELDYLILSNTTRRHLTREQRAEIFTFLQKRDAEDPDLKPKGGRPKAKDASTPKKRRRVDALAESLNTTVSLLKQEAEVLSHPLVNNDIKKWINTGVYTITQVFEAINKTLEDVARSGMEATTEQVIITLQNPIKPAFRLVDVLRGGTSNASKPMSEEPEGEGPKLEEPAPKPKKSRKNSELKNVEPTTESIGDRILNVRKQLEQLLGEADASPEVKGEVKALHRHVTGFLEGLGALAAPTSSSGLPDRLEDQLSLFTNLIQGIEEVSDPMGVRDLLLTLSMTSKQAANKLTQAKKSLEPNGLFCPKCFEPQMKTLSGEVCKNGHGVAPGLTQAQVVQAKSTKPKDDPDDYSSLLTGMSFEPNEDAETPTKPRTKKEKSPPAPKFNPTDFGTTEIDLSTL